MVLIFSIFIYLIKYIVISLYYSTRDIYISSYIILHNNNNIIETMNLFFALTTTFIIIVSFILRWYWILLLSVTILRIRFVCVFITTGPNLFLMYRSIILGYCKWEDSNCLELNYISKFIILLFLEVSLKM